MRHTQRIIFILLLLFAIPALHAETVEGMPAPTGYIDDYAHVLTPSAVLDMETTARELHDKTHAQVFLVTINTLEGEPVESFANQLFAKWKIGEKKTDRGALLLFSIKDHKRWIEIGYGLEGIFNDARVGDIGRSMVPLLKSQDYDQATLLGFSRVCTIIAADSNVGLDSLADATSEPGQAPIATQPIPESPTSSGSSFDWLGVLFPILWILIVVFIIVRALLRRGITPSGSGGYTDSSSWSDNTFSSSDSSFDSDSGSFSGGDGGSSGGGGAGGDW